MKDSIKKMLDSLIKELKNDNKEINRNAILHKLTGKIARGEGHFERIRQHDISEYCQFNQICEK